MVFLWIDQINEKKKSLEIRALSESISQQEKEAQELLENKKLEDSFYQKLEDNFAVNVLIVGDSIGTGAGIETDGQQWFTQLQSYLRKINKNSVSLTNVSMGGNTSYAGYVRTEMLDDDINYEKLSSKLEIMIWQLFVMDKMIVWMIFLLIMSLLFGPLKINIQIVLLFRFWNLLNVSIVKK